MSKPVPLLIVQRAREIISDEQHWCRGCYARGKAGTVVAVDDPDARRYCAMGALIVAAWELCNDNAAATNLAHDMAKIVSPTGSLVFVNDHFGHSAVLSLFDVAIARLQH